VVSGGGSQKRHTPKVGGKKHQQRRLGPAVMLVIKGRAMSKGKKLTRYQVVTDAHKTGWRPFNMSIQRACLNNHVSFFFDYCGIISVS